MLTADNKIGINLCATPEPSPCDRDCPKRSVECHSTCKDYIKWKKKVDEANHARWLEEQRYTISDTKRKWIVKNMKDKRRK